MERLIPIINKLQDVFNTVGQDIIDLPQICVIGSQSSGKSSVLESIVGRDFLPRGSGIVTRRPLILQLIHLEAPPPEDQPQEYGEFAHLPGQIFTDFNAINEEIVNETDRVTGTGKNVSPKPISLRLWSNKVLNLTLVDLPGITKVAVGDQPQSIVQEIYDMVKSFAIKPNCLILAITPANQDLANSDSLKLAREVDPAGDRTIGVITKVDLMDQGTNARDILENKIYPLKLGYIGVVNRSQNDINTNKSMEDARKDERQFFENHRDYSDLADRCGTAYLTVVLNRLLMEHIRSCMPSLRHTVQTMLEQKETELEGYGTDPTTSKGTLNAFVLDVITKYLDIFNTLLSGKRDKDDDDTTSRGGARISRVFLTDYEKAIDELPGLAQMNDKQVFNLMKNHAGLSVPLFTPHKAFDMVLFRTIEQLRAPSMKLIDDVVKILFDIHNQVDFMELSRFNILADAIHAVVDECIRSCIKPTQDFVSDLIDNERSFINTARPDFRGDQAIYAGKAKDPRTRPLPEKPAVPDPVGVCSIYGASKELTPHQSTEIKDLEQIGGRYFDIIRRQIKDLVPKAIVKFLVNRSTEMLRPKMIDDIFTMQELTTLLQEDPSITRKRIACTQIVTALRKAQVILLEVRTLKI
ncbi:Dynamin central region family protein [Trichomonas vaginalis G3]|uniref:Dynamin central region family protein n=1 Tax=Trichomonas vaginalis (strain ATCC PRA-98 / G3) TaxID=412133 RepID=A2FA90_TRIV3|nr:dynamin family [Trichomonas vaginalis G3]EAX98164.1 Dynamin central region family protein [Trichomonas vaginalis G3]KAI5515998.1 dynamin family [Trichomonas vaginalis G3]|eukprot:XP_001311094.1 Dynamin central region family protein [Trichomonas vaginalis G3]